RHWMAELLQTGLRRERRNRRRRHLRDAPDRSDVQGVWRPSGSCLPGRPAPHRPAILHQFRRFETRSKEINRRNSPPRLRRGVRDPFPLAYREEAVLFISVIQVSTAVSKPKDVVQGTLDLLILKILALEPMHGWAISQRLKQVSRDVLQVSDGSLYPALHKLEQQGWIKAEWKPSENNRKAKFYELTRAGRKELEKEAANWSRLSAAITHVVKLREA